MKLNVQRVPMLLLLSVVCILAAAQDAGASEALRRQQSVVKISDIQGTVDTSPLNSQIVSVTAICIGDFQDTDADATRNLGGFYIQEEASDYDSDPLTSEGIWVYDKALSPAVDVKLGDKVTVVGQVKEYFGETEIVPTSITVVSSGNALPPATEIRLLSVTKSTLNQEGDFQPDLEAFEGMLVTFPETLQISEQYLLSRFNEIRLVAGGRPYQFTQVNDPNPSGLQVWLEAIGRRTITYDDGLFTQNVAQSLLEGFGPTYNTSTAPRMADTIVGLNGVLTYQWAGASASGSKWRLRGNGDNQVNKFVSTNPRTNLPPAFPDGLIRFASLNVLNFFTTLDDGGSRRSGPSNLEPRGANSAAEFDRQLQKLVTGVLALGSDVVGLLELENEYGADRNGDGAYSIGTLIDTLNARQSIDVFAYVNPGTSYIGTDAIAVGIIYKTNKVKLVGGHAILDSSVDPNFIDTKNRPALAQSFRGVDEAESSCFTIISNHLKSKGSDCNSESDPDLNDGAGNCNLVRTKAAQALATWANNDPTGTRCPDVALLGDFNSYAREDPIKTLKANGFTPVEDQNGYSYVFDGQLGTLDYIFLNDSFGKRKVQAEVWHVNEDEATALDYNLDYARSPLIFDGTVPARQSDHSPLLVGAQKRLAKFLDTKIYQIQGTTATSPMVGQQVRVRGVVTGDYQDNDAITEQNKSGFYIQSMAYETDSNALTSEAVFVFDGTNPAVDVKVGDLVTVVGTVTEHGGETQIRLQNITDLAAENMPLPAPVEIRLLNIQNATKDQSGNYQPDLEAYEGMLVTFPESLQIADQSNLAAYKEIKLVAGSLPYHFTQRNSPSRAAFQSHLLSVGMRSITYSSGLDSEDAPITSLRGFGPVYNSANAPRLRDTVVGLTGVLSYQWSGKGTVATWRVLGNGALKKNSFVAKNLRQESSPAFDPRHFKCASVNALNFFTTIPDSQVNTLSGPSKHEPFGAKSQLEFNRQLEKLARGIIGLDADVVAISDVENEFGADRNGDGRFAMGALVDALNLRSDQNYAYIDPGIPYIGVAASSVAFVYKTDKVEPVGGPAVLDSSVDANFDDVRNRPALAQSFRSRDDVGASCTTMVVNQLAARESDCTAAGDSDKGDGAGSCNTVRTSAAQAVSIWIKSNPTGSGCQDLILLGSFSSFASEDPIQVIASHGFTSVLTPSAYSVATQSQVGSLDFLFINDGLLQRSKGAAVWNVNADEASALDYSLGSGRDPSIFNGTSPARHSDRNPLIVGISKNTTLSEPSKLKVHDIQGTGKISPYTGVFVEVAGIVVADYQNKDGDATRNLGGFYLQEEVADYDRDPLTSEGIFIYDGDHGTVDVQLGDKVTVVGFVIESSTETQILSANVTLISSSNSLPPPISIDLLSVSKSNLAKSGNYEADLEAFEGMLVQFTSVLQIADLYQSGPYSEMHLVAGKRPYHFSQLNDPSSTAYQAYQMDLGKRSVVFEKNVSVGGVTRMGDTVSSLTGVLSYRGRNGRLEGLTWRVQDSGVGSNSLKSVNSRPLQPPLAFRPYLDRNKYKVVSIDVYNFFTTLNDGSSMAGPESERPRGAKTAQEYKQQLEKLTAAMIAMDADIFGLVHLENEFMQDQNGDGLFAIDALVKALNAASTKKSGDMYAHVSPDAPYLGTDATAVGLIFRSNRVVAAGSSAVFNSPTYPSRSSLAQSFRALTSSSCITVSVHDLMSKSSSECPDDGVVSSTQAGGAQVGSRDGTGQCDQARTTTVASILSWMEDDPTGESCSRSVLLGSFNSYAHESPVKVAGRAGFVNILSDQAYNTVVDGKMGTLDYIMIKGFSRSSLLLNIVQADVWHINEDEASSSDYYSDMVPYVQRDESIFASSKAGSASVSPARFSNRSPVIMKFPW